MGTSFKHENDVSKKVDINRVEELIRKIKFLLSKLKQKNCDLVVVNDVSKKDSGLNSDYNRVSIIDNSGKIKVIKKNQTN